MKKKDFIALLAILSLILAGDQLNIVHAICATILCVIVALNIKEEADHELSAD